MQKKENELGKGKIIMKIASELWIKTRLRVGEEEREKTGGKGENRKSERKQEEW